MTHQTVQDVLLASPGVIRDATLELFKHKDRVEAAVMRARLRETDVALAVARTTVEGGKKAFSNESERDGETRKRLAADEAYNDARRDADEERAICQRIEAALGYHKNRFRSALAISTSTGNLDLDFPEAA